MSVSFETSGSITFPRAFVANLTLTLTFPPPIFPALVNSTGRLTCINPPHRTNDCTSPILRHLWAPRCWHEGSERHFITFTAAHVSVTWARVNDVNPRCWNGHSALCVVWVVVFFLPNPLLLCLASQRYLRPISTIFLFQPFRILNYN